MSTELFGRRKKKEPLELQLTAMIDVFSMIVIFLIFGTVFGAADMVVPDWMKIPKSLSKEGIESAPRVSIEKTQVVMSLLPDPIPIDTFRNAEKRDALKKKLSPLVAEQKEKRKATVESLNLVADQDTSYQDVFDVLAVFRESGFNTILFVATGGK